jgi:hypothetical protein
MSLRFLPVAEPPAPHWPTCWYRVAEAAPDAPAWFRAGVTRILTLPGVSPDALLLVADALEECASVAEADNERALSTQLRRLADLPRDLAPRRAKQEA